MYESLITLISLLQKLIINMQYIQRRNIFNN